MHCVRIYTNKKGINQRSTQEEIVSSQQEATATMLHTRQNICFCFKVKCLHVGLSSLKKIAACVLANCKQNFIWRASHELRSVLCADSPSELWISPATYFKPGRFSDEYSHHQSLAFIASHGPLWTRCSLFIFAPLPRDGSGANTLCRATDSGNLQSDLICKWTWYRLLITWQLHVCSNAVVCPGS